MKYLSKTLVLWFFVAISLGVFSNAESLNTSNENVKKINLFNHIFNVHSTISAGNFYDYTDNNGTQIQISLMNFSNLGEANIFMEDRLAQFKSIFQSKRVDYPGQYSKSVECPEEFKPKNFEKKIMDGRIVYFNGYAGMNRVAGVCTEDLVKYKHIYAMVICRKNSFLLEIEHTSALLGMVGENFINEITCEAFSRKISND